MNHIDQSPEVNLSLSAVHKRRYLDRIKTTLAELQGSGKISIAAIAFTFLIVRYKYHHGFSSDFQFSLEPEDIHKLVVSQTAQPVDVAEQVSTIYFALINKILGTTSEDEIVNQLLENKLFNSASFT